jgi:hypothetical protein
MGITFPVFLPKRMEFKTGGGYQKSGKLKIFFKLFF